MNECRQVLLRCHQTLVTAGTDLNTTATKAAAYIGAFFIILIAVIMGWRMFRHYAKGEYPQLGAAAVIGLVVMWFINHYTHAGAIVTNTFDKVSTG